MIAPGEDIDPNDFINESERDVTPANDAGKGVKLEADGRFSRQFLPYQLNAPVNINIDGTTTPQAVFISEAGSVVPSWTSNSNWLRFVGFIRSAHINRDPQSLGANVSSTSGTVSYTANAGANRVIVIHSFHTSNSGDANVPSGFTWNGEAFTHVQTIESNVQRKMSIWILPIGSSESNQTADIVRGGGSAGALYNGYSAVTIDKIDQSDPVLASTIQQNTSGSTVGYSLSNPQIYGANIQAVCGVGTVSFTSEGGTNLVDTTNTKVNIRVERQLSVNTSATSSNIIASGVALRGDGVSMAEVQFAGIVDGFTGLETGRPYYISSTQGAVGGATLSGNRIAVAISPTQMLITH
jgi:hypothetical protein